MVDADFSDSDSDSEAEQKARVESLEAELAANPSNYDSHLHYIKLLRRMGDVDKLSAAREAMSQLFPLTPCMWQEWIKDHLSLSPDSTATILTLYQRGLFDYLSVPLWCDYLNFVQESDPPVGISKVRDLFETALAAAGLHVSQGSLLWEAYRQFEQAILLTIDDDNETDATTQAKDKQVQLIRSLFHRQLSVPLADMTLTFTAYTTWEAEQGNLESTDALVHIPPHVASAYHKALDMYNARKHLEQQISNQDIPDSERLQHYMNYLKFEQSSGTPARVQVLYERAITDFPISPDLWLDYTRYLDKTLKVGNLVSNVYSRATKNCPWVGELWVRYLLCLERSHAPEKDLEEVFEKSLQCTFSTYDEYLDLFLTRVDGLRRRMALASTGEMDISDYKIIRETFQRASNYLSPHLKNTEVLLHMHAYWAHLETKYGKDIAAARGVWENFLKICGSMLEAWRGYIAMEIELGHVNEARSIYKRCYSKRFSGTGSEDICHSWLRFERELGKLEDFDHALQKVTPRLEELKLFRIQQASKLAEENENNPKRNARDKRKLVSDISDEKSPAKRQRDAGRNPKKAPEENNQVQNSSHVEKVEGVNQKINKTDNLSEQQSTPRNNRAYSDQHTAFISNIPPMANYEHIRSFFSDVGGVVAIRILHDKFTGKSRGLAYVDFIDDEHLAAAVAKNKHRLLGKKLSIARSDPKRGGKESSGPKAFREHVSQEDGRVSSRKGGDSVQLKGKNTFAVPRNVRPVGFLANKPKAGVVGDEKPKSNDEFRKMFIS
ncbi:hypothetical protein RIF29_23842 [Crotalaria pallida]|uniref:RRM domain-containing protein n=1 Tax=Crotalaria pallida TaxID=3830 RepID=A0AAN9EL46_CROPI